MSLGEIIDGRVFDDATSDERRTRVYVGSGELGRSGDDRPEVALMRALTDAPAPQRVHVVGPSGAGKTSLILKVVVDMARRERDVRHEVLILRVGDRPERLSSPEEVMKMVLETIAVEGHRFSNVDERVLRAAAADERTHEGAQVEHRGSLIAPVVGYTAAVRQAYEIEAFGQNAAQVRHDLEDVLRQVAEAGYRPVLVLDDTEKFVSPERDGRLDEESIGNLYHHGVRVLGELPVDLVVAMHPRFESVARVAEVIERLGMARIGVAELPADTDEPALARILARRMERDGIAAALGAVIDAAAVEELQVLYHDRDRDLRSVLKLAHAAAVHAGGRGAPAIAARDVRAAVVAHRG
ncbi:MAG: hypothetical protein ACR2KV_15115 [Solirubrobacteraceae bacterium]